MTRHDHSYRVGARCELLPYLLGLPLGLSRKQAKDLLRFRAVTVARLPTVKHDTRLEAGDVVTVTAGKQTLTLALQRDGLRVLHLDDAIVVIEKPAGLLSMGSETDKTNTVHRILNDHLKAIAKSALQQAFIVHRLDRETSGLMLLARNRSMQAALQRDWKQVTKKYLAVVEGIPPSTRGTLRDRLLESKSLKMHRVERGGELAITHYRVVKSARGKALVELTLETGRKNQIRVQMAGLGYPVVGDLKYGAAGDPLGRIALHACELSFRHPMSGATLEFRSAMPHQLMSLIGDS